MIATRTHAPLALVLGLALASCGDDAAPAEPAEPSGPTPPTTADDPNPPPSEDDPLAALEEPVDLSELVPAVGEGTLAAGATLQAATPPGACVALTQAPARVWPRAGVPAIAASPTRPGPKG